MKLGKASIDATKATKKLLAINNADTLNKKALDTAKIGKESPMRVLVTRVRHTSQ